MKKLLLVGCLLMTGQCWAVSTETLKEALPKIVELRITRIDTQTAEMKKKNRRRIEKFATSQFICSGAFVTGAGDILTAKHCVEDASAITVLVGDLEYQASVVAQSRMHDLALIRINTLNHPYFRLAPSLEQGQTIYVLGSPLGLTKSFSTGVVAKLGGDVNYIDCSVLPGNSGGPVFNEAGEMVGVATAGFIVMMGTTHLNLMQSLEAIYGFAMNGD